MAFALNQDDINATIKFVDSGLNQAEHRVELAFTTDLATTLANLPTIAAAYAAVTDCAVNQVSVNLVYINDAPEVPAGEVELVGQIVAKLDITDPLTGKSKVKTLRIPGIADALRSGASGTENYNVINLADANVTALLGLFEAPTPVAYLSHGQTADSFTAGKYTHRRSSKG